LIVDLTKPGSLDLNHIGRSRDGLVGYDAALTQLRSRVRFPVFVSHSDYDTFCKFALLTPLIRITGRQMLFVLCMEVHGARLYESMNL
jgi:hypothetical protein